MSAKIIKIRSETDDIQHAKALSRNRSKRQEHRIFFVEGVQTIKEALGHGWKAKAIYYAGDQELSSFARAVLQQSNADKHFELPTRLFHDLRWASKMEKRSELIALFRMPEDKLNRIPIHKDALIMVFDRPANHGNLGTVIRTCEAFKVDGLVITGHAVDLYDPQTIRSSMSSLFSFPIIRLPSHKDLYKWFEKIREVHPGFSVTGSSAHVEQDLRKMDLTRPRVLVIGNETEGLSANYKALCDDIVRIPISGSVTSLNVGTAAAIILYQAAGHSAGTQMG